MERWQRDHIVERLRAGASVALALDGPPPAFAGVVDAIEREARQLGRVTIWVDLEGATSGAEMGARIVEGCIHHLDIEELGDLLERLPSRGRLDLDILADLLMLPEMVAERSGHRTIAIFEGFHTLERVIGFAGLAVARDALMLRDRAAYLFVGARRVEALFGRPNSPLYGMAEVVEVTADGRARHRAAPPAPAPPPASDDPLAAALLAYAEPPTPEPRAEISPARLAWETLVEREMRDREWFDDDEDGWRRDRRGRRRR